MIRVLPIQLKSEQDELCHRFNTEYIPEAMAYQAIDDEGNPTGICQFTLTGGIGHLLCLEAESPMSSFDILFTLGRATLSFIELCGIKKAFYDGKITDEVLLGAIGFKKNSDGKYLADLTSLFNSPCCK